jgi:membrane protein DedA with SNARE-associated domain
VPTFTAGLDPLLQDKSLVYLGLFLAALIDATGFPFPGRLVLIASAATMARSWLDVAALTGAGALGAAVGDHLWYVAGRLGAGPRLTALYCRLSLASTRCERRARARFERFGPLAIVIGRFVAGVRVIATPMAGGGAISYPRYLLYELVGCVLWAGVFVVLGYALGAQGRALMEGVGGGALLVGVAILVGLGLAAVVLARLTRRRRHGRAGSLTN